MSRHALIVLHTRPSSVAAVTCRTFTEHDVAAGPKRQSDPRCCAMVVWIRGNGVVSVLVERQRKLFHLRPTSPPLHVRQLLDILQHGPEQIVRSAPVPSCAHASCSRWTST